jgi:hypothetical protein
MADGERDRERQVRPQPAARVRDRLFELQIEAIFDPDHSETAEIA